MIYLKKAVRTAETDQQDVRAVVTKMLAEIEAGGEAVAQRYARDLDKWDGAIIVSPEERKAAAALVPERLKADIPVPYTHLDVYKRQAHNGSGIAAVADLKGRRVAVPVGSTAHFSLMGAIAHAGLTEADVTIMSMPPDQIAAAWEQGTIDAAFIWPPVQTQLLESGTRIVGADKTAEWGYPTFNAWVANTQFAAEHQSELVAFAKAMDAANQVYLNDKAGWTADN